MKGTPALIFKGTGGWIGGAGSQSQKQRKTEVRVLEAKRVDVVRKIQ